MEGMASKNGAARQGYTIHQGHGVGEGIKHGDEVGQGIHLGYKSVSISCPGKRPTCGLHHRPAMDPEPSPCGPNIAAKRLPTI